MSEDRGEKATRNEKINLYGNSPEEIAEQILNTPPPERLKARDGKAKRRAETSEESPERQAR